MAAILQLRRGTTVPSLAQSELFFNTSNNTLVVGDGSSTHILLKSGSNTGDVSLNGNLTINGGISGSTLNITGNAKIDGNLTLGGGLIKLGDEGTDEIEFVGVLSGSLIPETDGIYDIGASDARYNNIYLLSASIEELNGIGLDSFISNTNLFTQSADGRLDNLELETGSITTEQLVQDGRLNNLETFSSSQELKDLTLANYTSSVDSRLDQLSIDSASQDGRLDNLELFSSSQELKNSTLETYTSSNDDNITELFTTASDHESRIDVIEGTFSSSVDSRLDYLEGSFSTSVDDRLDQLEVHSGSTDSRLDNIEGVSGSYATTGSNLFIGNQEITGSLSLSGSLSIKGLPWATAPRENHLIETNPFSITTDSGVRNYEYAAWTMDNYQVSPGVYNPSFVFYMYDQPGTANFGSQLLVGPLTTNMFILASGSRSETYVGVQDLLDGTTSAKVYGTYVDLGVQSGSFIQIGNPTSLTNIESANLVIESPITGSSTIEGTYFHGDGRYLTNVTASYVEYNNVVNKPTLVSGSTQIDVNNTQNFQTFSSSVDSRLDYIEGGLSSSINSQLENIHQYTASLRDSIDVNGQDLTIYGNLTVQGTTTTLNTTELVIEDKLLSLASGSTTSAEADGAGLHISGADASMTWDDVNSNMVFNTKVSSSVGFKGDGSELTNIQHTNIDFGGSNIVSGSSQITSSLDFKYLEINGDDVVSGSSQIIITDTTGFSTFSGSLKTTDDEQKSRLNNLELFSSSQESKDSTLQTLTSSYDGRLNNLEAFSSSQEDKDSNLGNYTASIDTKFNTLQTYTESIDSDLSVLHSYTQSIDTKFSTLENYTSSNDNDISNLESFTSSQETKNSTLETYTSSVDDRLSNLELTSGSHDIRLDNIESVTSSYETKGNGIVSGSDQVTSSLDLRYLEINSDSVVSGSDQVTSSLDLRYEQSGSVAQLVGIHGISGSLGSAAWYNVSSSISNGDPAVLGNAGAVKDYIDEQLLIIGAGDITAVIAGDGMGGGADSGPATLTLDTASAHFNEGVQNNLISLNSYTQSNDTNQSAQNSRLSNLESFTSSLDVDYVNQTELADATGSLINSIATKLDTGSYLLDSASVDSRLDTLEGTPTENPLSFVDSVTIDFTRTVDSITAIAIGGILSSSNENFTDFSSSVDDRMDLLSAVSHSHTNKSNLDTIDQNLSTTSNVEFADGIFNGDIYTSGSIIPKNPATSLGTAEYPWGDLWIGGFTLHIGGTAVSEANIVTTQSLQTQLPTGIVSSSTQISSITEGSGILSSSVDNFDTFSGSIAGHVVDINLYTQSNDSTNTSQNSRLTNLELETGSISNEQSVQDSRLSQIELVTSSLGVTYEQKASGTHTLVSGSDQLSGSLVDLISDQTISGTKTFTDIVVNGTGSFAYLVSTQNSVQYIGDSFIVLNNDTPTQRFAGVAVYDSGSANTTASLQFDGQTNDWFYEYSTDGGVTTDHGAVLFGPEYSTKGSPTYLTSNRIPKSVGSHHLNDSNITDSGTLITLGSNVQVNGNIAVTGTVDGIDLQAFSTLVGNKFTTLASYTSSNDTTNTTQNSRLDQLSTYTGSTAPSLFEQKASTTHTLVSGSSQIDITSTTGTLDISSRTNLSVSDTANVDMILTGDTLSANLKGGVVSGSAQITKSLQDVCSVGNTTSTTISITNTTASTSKTSGALVVTGGIGIGGDVFAGGDVVAYASSDRRLKNEITPIENPLQKINKIGGYSFVWNENQHIYKGKDYGVIAQEIEEILPELVETRDNGYKAVKYDKLVSLLIEGIKDLSKEVQDLKEQINKG